MSEITKAYENMLAEDDFGEDLQQQIKERASKDARAVSERVTTLMDEHHLETLKEQAKAYSRDEQFAVASSIDEEVLLKVLEEKIRGLKDFKRYIINGVS